jgi:uncharacterized phage protein (TIGR02216 family)
MQFGFGVLHLSSDAFWKMTPRELAQAIAGSRGRAPAPIERGDFDALMRQFPDGSAVIASEAKQSRETSADWIASSRSLSSGRPKAGPVGSSQ